ncbi:Swt1 family HEPN domain-containing protein [Caldibacillus lycopersici]|uniref:Swt1 family HEPN domain-containing protein n=1 Tax=Perspicuibacillus lycopersici TaxID=1325689 RepID=A0AAE3ITE9_9BACI|nr:Swt1 family HEPN domain-containing protein [Perspicuibacillus lycopersici]MCU9614047.1 Swt1 family HEPN domain-containing protein [Perspicuibacillus lycopersici]
MSFTYNLSFSNEKLLDGLIYKLKRMQEHELAQLLRGASLSIETGGYSYYDGGRGRPDAMATNIYLYVNPINIDGLDNDNTKELLRATLDKLIPAEVGYDVKRVIIEIDLSKDFELEDDLISDLEKQSDRLSGKILSKILPTDIKEKGYYMAEVYTYLYAVENSLRLFIEEVCKDVYGDDYFSKITVPNPLRNTITNRVEKAQANKWLSVRGDSKLFYLDFKDLGAIISNNWDVFKKYFPSQDFIIPKIDEMAECRNLIAHNSIVHETERSVIKTYYNVILKQISKGFED